MITLKMQKYFWAMYYSLAGKVTYSVKTKKAQNNQRNRQLSTEASYWKAMALKKVGTRIIIRQRQFIGHHSQVDSIVGQVADRNFKDLATQFKSILKPKP